MNKARQTFVNDKDGPIYITIEPSPECYELEPGETLTLIYDVPDSGDALSISIINEGVVVWPLGDEPGVLVNGADARGRSWKFKHHGRDTV
jgi:hypothetical protein